MKNKFSPLSDTPQRLINSEKIGNWLQTVAPGQLENFGFKNSGDLDKFLKTPSGKVAAAMIEKNTALVDAFHKANFTQLIGEQLASAKRTALAFLALAYKEEKIEQLNELAAQQIEKRLADNKEALDDKPYTDQNAFAEADEILDEEIAQALAEAEALNKELTDFSNLAELEDQQHALAEQHIHDLLEEIDSIPMEERLAWCERQITQVANHGDFANDRVMALQHAIAVTQSNQEREIVKEGNQYYLLPANTPLQSLSIEQKASAKKAYEDQKSDMSSVKELMKNKRNTAANARNERFEVLLDKSHLIQQKLVVLNNQGAKMHALAANIRQEQGPDAPTPSLSGGTANKTAAAAPVAQNIPTPAPQSLKNKSLQALEQLDQNTQRLQQTRNQPPRNLQQANQMRLNRLRFGNMSHQDMNALFRTMSEIGQDPVPHHLSGAAKPPEDLGKTINPNRLLEEKQKDDQVKEPDYKTPTPFRTNPNPDADS